MPKPRKTYQSTVNQKLIKTVTLAIMLVFYGCTNQSVQETEVSGSSELLNFIRIKRSAVDYTLILESDTLSRSLAFFKNKDSSVYQHLNYQFYSEKEVKLKDELHLLNELWSVAEDSIDVNITSLMVGYPLEYVDVLQNQILAFRDSPKWNDLQEEGQFQNYQLMREIMKEKKVYSPLYSLLKPRGLEVVSFSTEKHGYVPIDKLKNLGFDERLKIPVPFMVWVNVNQIAIP